MKPDFLILDEPTAGLDPKSRKELLDMISELRKKNGMTVVLVSHSMEDVAEYVDRIVVMNEGKVFLDGSPKEVFLHYRNLEQIGLRAPQVTYVVNELRKRGLPVDVSATTVTEAKNTILDALRIK